MLSADLEENDRHTFFPSWEEKEGAHFEEAEAEVYVRRRRRALTTTMMQDSSKENNNNNKNNNNESRERRFFPLSMISSKSTPGRLKTRSHPRRSFNGIRSNVWSEKIETGDEFASIGVDVLRRQFCVVRVTERDRSSERE